MTSSPEFSRSKSRAIAAIGMVVLAYALAGCQNPSAVQQFDSQYASDYQVKSEQLQPMVGVFYGNVHLLQNQADFKCQVILSVTPDTENSPQAEDPSETVQVARLGGSIGFPALEKLPLDDYAGFMSLWNPLDDLPVVKVDHGDYNPGVTPPVVLPYLAQDKSDFGKFMGDINGDEFTGVWYADDFGNVGTFDLHRISKTPAVASGGGR